MTIDPDRSAGPRPFVSVLRRGLRAVGPFATAAIVAALALVRGGIHAQAPGPCDPPNGNAITCENQLTGNPSSEWDIDGAGDPSIQGFATDISVNRGETISFKIQTDATAYTIDIYRMGYYGGMGARKVATITPSATLPQTQPPCLADAATGLNDCGNWDVSASWPVPADATSGIYFAKLTRGDTSGASHIVFIVRNDASHSDLFFQTSDTTWQAYNQYGGNSLYVGGPATDPGRAYKVSYNRPFTTRGTAPQDWVFNAEYPMVRWLEANGYDTTYTTGVDSDRSGILIKNHKVFLSVGHDEYWSGSQRANVEAARDAGVNLAFFSGNEIFWKTRWETAMSSDGTPYRTLVSYKETHANAKIDPQANVWTGTWADPRFSPPADGGKPQNALSGTLFSVNCCTYAITVPSDVAQMRFWRGTDVANLTVGQVATMPDGTLGYEWDSDVDNGFRPAGLMRLSHSTLDASQVLQDYGSTYAQAIVEHALTLYRHASGALVFGAGTVQWSWGLDSHHDRGSAAPDRSMQQATVNLFADMGTQPLSLATELSTASASTDTDPPSSSVTFPTAGSHMEPNTEVTISGIASDLGGGQVAGVEVSLDNGVTWHRATGTSSWSYTSHTGLPGTFTAVSRAVDDTGNVETPGPGVTFTIDAYEVTAPGGPILVVTSQANPFTTYYAEILRAEGLNAFALRDISQIDAPTLAQYDVVVLGDQALTDAQATMVTDWVSAGGNLVTMRPDSRLATLLGLTSASTTLADAYMKVDTSAAPGSGIVGQTMQFHGTADRYTLSGATAVATLYTDANTATANPAVTIRNVGSAGGHAAAFTYDLARSVVYTRQGNPAWSGQERDEQGVIRSDDLFFGGSEPNYVDLSKVAIPQADEQQRLLANIIEWMNSARRPLPKFWYLPRGLRAAIVMTGDDHGNNGTAGRFDIYNSTSTPGCSLADWECVRATSYLYPTTPIAPAQVAAYRAQGFEIGVHIKMIGPDDCSNYSVASALSTYSTQIDSFRLLFGNTPILSSRTHCVVWSDYDSQSQIEAANGIRFDTNYYYWPGNWVNDTPGLFTGSGFPMRFAKLDGTTIDAYQATTQLTDESDQTYPFTVNTLLDRALGPEGYYGAFVANMHTDVADHPGSVAIIASAQSRGVPIVSAEQMLEWVDGRNSSTFETIAWNGTTLSFAVTEAAGARGLQTMVPAVAGSAALTGLTKDGAPISYTLQVIKGINYAMFPSSSGTYIATYAADSTPPDITDVAMTPATTTATATWNTSEAATSSVLYGTNPSALTSTASIVGLATSHSVQLTGLAPTTTYYYRVVSADDVGNSATSPASPTAPGQFTTTAVVCPCSIWTPSQSPIHPAADDPLAVELGLRFRASADGFITGVRFYKSTANIGPHVGNLWTNSGTLLGTVEFSNESASGWQQATFSGPIPITANTTYVVSYHTESGAYATDPGTFQTSGVINVPLQALATGVDGPNGVFVYGQSAFPTETLSGTNYWVDVVFETAPVDTLPPTVSGVTPTANATNVAIGAAVAVTFSEAMNAASVHASSVELRDGTNVLVPSVVTYDAGTHTATLQPSSPLAYSTTYSLRVASGLTGVRDASGNPLAADFTASFITEPAPPPSVKDTTFADFSSGTAPSGIYVAHAADGEVVLTPSVALEFDGAALPTGWSSADWNIGATTTLASGKLTVDGSRAGSDTLVAPGQSLEFSATFSSDTSEHGGFAVAFDDSVWAIFSTSLGGGLFARTNDGIVPTDTLIAGNWLGTPHRYRIDWTSTSVTFFIDGTQVASHSKAIPNSLRPVFSDFNVGGGSLAVDWMRLAPFATNATFTSRVLDIGSQVVWSTAEWTARVPNGTSVALKARFGNTPVPDATWTAFATLSNSGMSLSAASRYVQYQATLTGDGAVTPELNDVTFIASTTETPPAPVSVSIGNVTLPEGNVGTTNADFTVTLSAASTQIVGVNYTTANDTAVSGGDYVTTSGQLIFQPGTTSLTISVPVVGDTTAESAESFKVNLSDPVNATIGTATGVGTITDDDSLAPAITAQPVSRTVSMGLGVSFTASAAGNPSVTHQWQVSANGGTSWTNLANAFPYSGVDTATLSVSASPGLNGVRYRYVGTNTLGSATSNAAVLTVTVPSTMTLGDFNGDHKRDMAFFRPSEGKWYVRDAVTGSVGNLQWGVSGDVPVAGDYDGDGKTDIAVFRPSEGIWYIRYMSTGATTAFRWGAAGDIPVPGDYNKDGKTDAAVFRPSEGVWYILFSGSGATSAIRWGAPGDIPVAGDYDGDGLRDVAVYRPSQGVWYVRFSASGATQALVWGIGTDVPVPADYDGDGKTDIAVYRPSEGVWYLRYSRTGATAGIRWGNIDDVPVVGDFNNDGLADTAIYRRGEGVWYLRYSGTATTGGMLFGDWNDVPF